MIPCSTTKTKSFIVLLFLRRFTEDVPKKMLLKERYLTLDARTNLLILYD